MPHSINGIQHIGIGINNSDTTLKWFRKYLGMNIPLFDGTAPAPLMNLYTEEPNLNKRASMILNLQGGCALELVEPISSTSKAPNKEYQLGDKGIFITQFKTPNIQKLFEFYKKEQIRNLSDIEFLPNGESCFYFQDPAGLHYQIIESKNFFSKGNHLSGGVCGCTIGVSNIEESLNLYSDLLGYDLIVYDETKVFPDWKTLPGSSKKLRRIRLKQSNKPKGGFANLTGETFIELVQTLEGKSKKIYENRYWGDIGFLHLGLDIRGMANLEKEFKAAGFPFTCNSDEVLDMGSNTKVHCTYIEDPDGTLIELIEVYKIAILERFGIYLDISKRNLNKPLPKLMLKALRFNRVRD